MNSPNFECPYDRSCDSLVFGAVNTESETLLFLVFMLDCICLKDVQAERIIQCQHEHELPKIRWNIQITNWWGEKDGIATDFKCSFDLSNFH